MVNPENTVDTICALGMIPEERHNKGALSATTFSISKRNKKIMMITYTQIELSQMFSMSEDREIWKLRGRLFIAQISHNFISLALGLVQEFDSRGSLIVQICVFHKVDLIVL